MDTQKEIKEYESLCKEKQQLEAKSQQQSADLDRLYKYLAAMKDGYVQALIAQHSDQQAAAAIETVVDHAILHMPLSKRDNFTQMDILNRYNCDYYL